MAKKFILNENQYQTLLNIIKEQRYDDIITKYQKEQNENVNIPISELKLLINLGMIWCQGKDNHTDCDEIMKIRSKYDLYNF